MCMLSYLPTGVGFDFDSLFNGGLSNPDGHGWAIATSKTILVGKSLDLCEALTTFEEARKKHLDGPALFHSRWATHGPVTTANVHPFFVGGQHGQTVVAHNGVLSSTPKKGDKRSDTRVFADDILSTRYRRLDKATAFQAMTDWAGPWNKLVILTVNPRYRHRAYLVNQHKGIWQASTGIWHSNYDYLDLREWENYRSTRKTTVVVRNWDQEGAWGNVTPKWSGQGKNWDDCAICHYGIIAADGFCDECGSCDECLETRGQCQCWARQAVNAAYSESEGQEL